MAPPVLPDPEEPKPRGRHEAGPLSSSGARGSPLLLAELELEGKESDGEAALEARHDDGGASTFHLDCPGRFWLRRKTNIFALRAVFYDG